MDWGSKVTYLAQTAFKEGVVPFGIKDVDRLEHLAVMGKAGTGRATLFTTMALQDIERGMSVVVLDASGNLAPMLLERLGENARKRVVFIDPSDGEHPFSWNPVEEFRPLGERAPSIFSDALASMYKIPAGALTASASEFILVHKDASVLSLYNAVVNEKVREKMFGAGTPERLRFEEALKADEESTEIISEHGRYVAKDTLIRNVIGQIESKFSLAQGDEGAILVVDFSRIRMFPTRITPLVRLFTHAARARGLLGENIALYLFDSLKYLSEDDVERVLPERKVACAFASTPQGEEEKVLYEHAFRRCGSVLTFAPHPADFSLAEHIFYPYVSPEDLAKLKERELCAVLTIDAVRAKPFFAMALPRPERTGVSYQDVQTESRGKYTISRVKADELFKPAPPEGTDKDKKDGEPGSFSDAFRSIFSKRAPGTPQAPAKEGDAKTPPPTPDSSAKNNAPEKKTAPATQKEDGTVKSSEIPEEDLRRMVYVEPLAA